MYLNSFKLTDSLSAETVTDNDACLLPAFYQPQIDNDDFAFADQK